VGASPLGDALTRGSLGLDAYAERQQWVFKLQRGITDNLSLGVAVQVIRQSIHFNYQIGGVNTAADIYSALGTGGTIGGSLGTFDSGLQLLSKLNSSDFQSILASKGYEPLGDSEKSGLGDLILGSRYKWKDQEVGPGKWMGSLEARLTLPTGGLSKPSQLVGTDFGSGAVSLMIGHNSSLNLNGKWGQRATQSIPYFGDSIDHFLDRLEIFHNIAFTQNFPYERVRRIRTSPGDFLPDSSTEEPVTIALGNSWMQSFGVSYTINPSLIFTAQLDWMFRNKDKILTAGPDTTRANYLADGTDGELKTLQLTLNPTTVTSFFRGGFPVPADLFLTYSQPLSGKNQLLTPYGLAELALYF
jgi:hypothetical protein